MNIPDRYIDYALNKIWDAAKERDQGKRKKYNGYKDKPNRTCFYRETGGQNGTKSSTVPPKEKSVSCTVSR